MTVLRCALLGVALGATAVVAAAPPCADDVAKLCADESAAGGGKQTCLQAKEKELSPRCVSQLEAVKGWQGALSAPCRWDIAVLCADVEPGGGRVAKCLEGKKDDLTPGCKDRVGKPATP